MIVRPAKVEARVFVALGLRRLNITEIMATQPWGTSERDIGEEIVRSGLMAAHSFALFQDPVIAVALLDIFPLAEGTVAVRLVATDRWLTIAPAAYRWLKREVLGVVLADVRRVETRVLDRGPQDRAWLRRMGFADEGVCRAAGRNGEDFVQVAWVNPRWRRADV